MRHTVIGCGAAVFATAGFLALSGAGTVPDRFEVTTLVTGLATPKGLDSALFRAGAGPMGSYLYVAESGADQILEVDRFTGDMEIVAYTLGSFPVGLSCFGGAFDQFMYVGNAFGGGIVRIDQDGFAELFALDGMDIAGLDFGHGPFGADLYAGEWTMGSIWRVDVHGNATLFASIPTCETRYLQFSQGGPFGTYLYFTDAVTGDIYRVDPSGQEEVFASTGADCLEGLAFSPGGAFGKYLYVGDVCSGEIFRVAPNGAVEVWADGFDGVADIIFKPGGVGGFTMYLVDGHSSVFAIQRMAGQPGAAGSNPLVAD